MLKLNIHFDCIKSTVVAVNSDITTFEEEEFEKYKQRQISVQNYFNSGQPWHYPCIADLECTFTEEPNMDYMGLAIVLGRISIF